MKGNRLDIEDPVESVRSFSACLFSQEGYRVAFIEQAKLAFRILQGSGIDKNASLDKVTVYIGYHRTDVPGCIGS